MWVARRGFSLWDAEETGLLLFYFILFFLICLGGGNDNLVCACCATLALHWEKRND